MNTKTLLILYIIILLLLLGCTQSRVDFNKKMLAFQEESQKCFAFTNYNTSELTEKELIFLKNQATDCLNQLEIKAKEIKEHKAYEEYIKQIPDENRVATKFMIEEFSEFKNYMINAFDFLIESKKLESSFQLLSANIKLWSTDACIVRDEVQKATNEFQLFAPKVKNIANKTIQLSDKFPTSQNYETKNKMENLLHSIEVMPQFFGMLMKASDSACIIQTEIKPAMDYSNKINTIHNLEKKSFALEEAKTQMQEAITDCKKLVTENPELSQTTNINFGTCASFYPTMEGIELLQRMVEEGVSTTDSQGFSEQQMFTTMYNYSDILNGINPIDPNVRTIATQLAREYEGDKTPQQAQAIYQYVRDEVNYVQTPLVLHQRVQTPAATLQLKSGNCADKSVLLTSLLMSVGFPTRMVLQDTQHQAEYYTLNQIAFSPNHALIQVQINNEWFYADATCKSCPLGQLGSTGAIIYMTIPPK